MKTRKLTAILLALCMLLSLSVSAFAADDAIASGTIPDSKITWELDSKGWLTISGSGDGSAFTSKDDQPWAEYRSQITQVWFDGMESLAISDLAYWFEDCTSLTTAEIPSTTPVIGKHAFYNCPLLTKLSIYYGEYTLDSIGEDAFWRETDNGDTLYVAYIIGYPYLTVSILNPAKGEIDSVRMKIGEIISRSCRSTNPNLRNTEPHIWVDGKTPQWYACCPGSRDYTLLANATAEYLSVFELTHERMQNRQHTQKMKGADAHAR